MTNETSTSSIPDFLVQPTYDCPHCGRPGATITVEGNDWYPTLVVGCSHHDTKEFEGRVLQRVILGIVHNPNTPPETLAAFWLHRLGKAVPGSLVAVAKHANTPERTLDALADSRNHWQVRRALMENPNTHPNVRKGLSEWAAEKKKEREGRRQDERLTRQIERARKGLDDALAAWIASLEIQQRAQPRLTAEPDAPPNLETTLAAVQLFYRRQQHGRSWEDCWQFACCFTAVEAASLWMGTDWTPSIAACAHAAVGSPDAAQGIMAERGISMEDLLRFEEHALYGFPWLHWSDRAIELMNAIRWYTSRECHQTCDVADEVDIARQERACRRAAEKAREADERAAELEAAEEVYALMMGDGI